MRKMEFNDSDRCLWRPDKRRKTKMDEFRETVNRKYNKNLGKCRKHLCSAMLIFKQVKACGGLARNTVGSYSILFSVKICSSLLTLKKCYERKGISFVLRFS